MSDVRAPLVDEETAVRVRALRDEIHALGDAVGGWSLELVARIERLAAAILDIDAHATPIGEDDDGFVTGGYLISVGCLHRALGVVGHSAGRCDRCTAESHNCSTVERLRADRAALTEALTNVCDHVVGQGDRPFADAVLYWTTTIKEHGDNQ